MQGAKDCAPYFETGQYEKLYIVSGEHARGRTFCIYVLPEGEAAKPNGSGNPPLNRNAVEVYGVTGGKLGWTETYGWLHEGKWQEDFYRLYEEKKREREEREWKSGSAIQKEREERLRFELEILASY